MFGLTHFRKVFLIRFLGYFFILTGLSVVTLIIEPVFNEELRYGFDQIVGKKYVLPKVITSAGQSSFHPEAEQPKSKSGFGDLLDTGLETIVPLSTEFGIVIEKINANAKVIANVDPGNENEYIQALTSGVAHAKGTAFPGQKGNIYLFSHSTDAPWNIVRYNAIFYLLGKLEPGDRVIMFYQGRRFDYVVFDKTIAKPEDTHFLTDTYEDSVLTLQTCDPPGTILNRLIIRARLAGG